MPSESVLRMRIEEAVREAERANANRDQLAYNRAAAKYAKADAWLTKLENERNEKAIRELEARAVGGELSHAKIAKAGIPAEVLKARGWENIPDRAGMRKVKADATAATSDEPGSA